MLLNLISPFKETLSTFFNPYSLELTFGTLSMTSKAIAPATLPYWIAWIKGPQVPRFRAPRVTANIIVMIYPPV